MNEFDPIAERFQPPKDIFYDRLQASILGALAKLGIVNHVVATEIAAEAKDFDELARLAKQAEKTIKGKK